VQPDAVGSAFRYGFLVSWAPFLCGSEKLPGERRIFKANTHMESFSAFISARRHTQHTHNIHTTHTHTQPGEAVTKALVAEFNRVLLCISGDQTVESTEGVSQILPGREFSRWATSPFGVTVSCT